MYISRALDLKQSALHLEFWEKKGSMPLNDWMDCCEDDWSVWLRFETWIWAVLLVVHLSMVVFLVVHGRTDKAFREAFYVFLVAVTLVDCAIAVLVSKRAVLRWARTRLKPS